MFFREIVLCAVLHSIKNHHFASLMINEVFHATSWEFYYYLSSADCFKCLVVYWGQKIVQCKCTLCNTSVHMLTLETLSKGTYFQLKMFFSQNCSLSMFLRNLRKQDIECRISILWKKNPIQLFLWNEQWMNFLFTKSIFTKSRTSEDLYNIGPTPNNYLYLFYGVFKCLQKLIKPRNWTILIPTTIIAILSLA